MSRANEAKLTCRQCGNKQMMSFWESINVDLDPPLRQKLFDGQLNVFRCEACGDEAIFAPPLLYHDMTRLFAVQYFPEQLLEDASYFDGYTTDGKTAIKLPVGIPGGRYLAEPHIVFHMDEMR